MSEIVEALTSSIQSIDLDCEAEVRGSISDLHAEVNYSGGRIRLPSFEQAGRCWIKMIKRKEERITEAVEKFITSIPYLSASDIHSTQEAASKIFNESRYSERLLQFKDGVRRSAQRLGISLLEHKLNNQVADAVYRAGVANTTRSAVKNIQSKITILVASRSSTMGFGSLMRDKVSVLKKNGDEHKDIYASVQSEKIFIQRSDILIEIGDLITRKPSNGGSETYEVLDPGFHEQFHGIPAGYQMRVRKLGAPESAAAIQHITYNISGNNARVNNNSTDNSINITANSLALAKIAELRREIEMSISVTHKKDALDVVDVIESQIKTGSPSKAVVNALLASLPQAANIATIASAIQGLF